MARKDSSPSAQFTKDLLALLDERLGLSLPTSVQEVVFGRAHAAGLTPQEAAIRICHEHTRRLCQPLIERERMASDSTELVIASRIDESARLAREMGYDLLDLLPDVGEFVRQPCFTDEFRDLVGRVVTRHGLSEHRWNSPQTQLSRYGWATA